MSMQGWIPEGSTDELNEDQTMTITPPTGWDYVGTREDNQEVMLIAGGQTKVSCHCNTTGSCLPFRFDKIAGCQGTCTNCTMTQSAAQTGQEFISGGYLNLQIEPRIITIGEEFPAAFKEMSSVTEVGDKILEFNNEIYQGQQVPDFVVEGNDLLAPEGYLIAMVDICGRAIPLIIPEDAMIANGAGGAKATCSCTEGTCTVDSIWIPGKGTLTYCTGTCTGTCTLKTKAPITDEVTFTAIAFGY